MPKGKELPGNGIPEKSHLDRLKEIYDLQRKFHTRFSETEPQAPPFENYRRVKGKATLNGITENVVTRKEQGQKSIIFIGGSLGEGKTTLFDELQGQFSHVFEPHQIGSCTAEEGLRRAMASIHSPRTSGQYTPSDYRLGSDYLEADILSAFYDERVKLVMIEAPSTTGIELPNRDSLLGMNRGTSAIKNLFRPDTILGVKFRDMLVGTIGLTNRDFKKGLLRRQQDIFISEFVPRRGGTYESTVKAEDEIMRLLINDPLPGQLFGIPNWAADYYPLFRREIQLARLEWLFNSYFQFPQEAIFIGEGSFRLTEQQLPVLQES